MHSVVGGRAGGAPSVETLLQADAVLDPTIRLQKGAAAAPEGPGDLFMTGSTGFLGTFILHDLLDSTDARIICLTRGADPAAELARIAQNLRTFELREKLPHGRLVPVRGDIALPLLGLSDSDYRKHSKRVGTIIHGAAVMNFYHRYERLRAANVGGTREILRFAFHGRPKVVHHISSSGVFDSRPYQGALVRETDSPALCDDGVTGYTQSKWAAERLVRAAVERGLPVCIHRPPFITGHAQTGAATFDNSIVKMMVGCIQGGYWPDSGSPLDLVPVDYVSRSVSALVSERSSPGRTLHYGAASRLRWADIGRALVAAGFDVNLVAYDRWKQELRRFTRSRHNALRPLAPLFLKTNPRLSRPVPEVFMESPRPHFDCRATGEYLSGLGIPPPVLDARLFKCYCGYFVRNGWIRHPVGNRVGPAGGPVSPRPRAHE